MQLGMIGLGRMGGNMVRRLMRGGHECAVFDLSPDNVKALEADGAKGASALEDLVKKLDAPRAVWVMVPSGDATEKTVNALAQFMSAGDIIIDGGNSNYKDDARRAKALAESGILYVDAGTSGSHQPDRTHFENPGPRTRRTGSNARTRNDERNRRRRLPALRSGRLWPFRENDSQRH